MVLKQMCSSTDTQVHCHSFYVEMCKRVNHDSKSGKSRLEQRRLFLGSISEAGLILPLPLESQQVAVLINGAWLLSSGKSTHKCSHPHTRTLSLYTHTQPILSRKQTHALTFRKVNVSVCVCAWAGNQVTCSCTLNQSSLSWNSNTHTHAHNKHPVLSANHVNLLFLFSQ